MKREAFVAKVVAEALSAGISVKILNKKSINKLGGWFDGKELVVAYNYGEGFSTLVHEYCHMQQYLENCKAWRQSITPGSELFLHWIRGKAPADVDHTSLFCSMQSCIAVEYDCEKRVLQCIKKYNLDIDAAQYAKGANIYLYAHHRMLQDNKWYVNMHHDHNYNVVPATLLPLKYYKMDTDKKGNKMSEQLNLM